MKLLAARFAAGISTVKGRTLSPSGELFHRMQARDLARSMRYATSSSTIEPS
jgi:hypothetical protein